MSFKVVGLLIGLLTMVPLVQKVSSLDNGLAATPPMGWMSWERFTCETDCATNPRDCISHQLYEETAKLILSGGYQEVGYNYVNIDDCWSAMQRNRNDELFANMTRFPQGIERLSYLIHSFGLKLGIYGDCGTATCAGYPAQLKSEAALEDNYFEVDANTFAKWEVDSFKFDGCNLDPLKAESICPKMAEAFKKTGRSILLTCEWPYYMLRREPAKKPDYGLAASSCNLWRYFDDVEDSWSSVLAVIDWTVKLQDSIVGYHGPGNWFDPDQLVIGNFGLSFNQARAQMALWSIWSAPLFMSNDLRDIDPRMASILKNRRVIEVDQDRMGVMGMMVAQDRSIQAFVKPVDPIRNGCPSFVIVYLNRQTLGGETRASFNLRELLSKSPIGLAAQRSAEVAGVKFDGDTCKKRIRTSMKRDPNSVPADLPKKDNFEYRAVFYQVHDLFDDLLPPEIGLDSRLTLDVNLSGVRMVKLTEV